MADAGPSVLDRSYAILAGDDSDERACREIDERSCTRLPRNYLLNVANGACTKLAEQLASPGLVLPWLLGAVGAHPVFAALLVPVKQAGSLIPQMFVAARIRALAKRKWAWAAAGWTQAAALVLMIAATLALPANVAGAAVVLLLLMFSVASGMGSVAFQDVTGKTVPKGVRGRMLSNRATIGGVLTIAAAVALSLFVPKGQALPAYIALIGCAAILWFGAAVLFAMIDETPGETGGGRSVGQELSHAVKYVRTDATFRKYLIVRCLLLSVEIAMPFYALLGQKTFEGAISALGIFVIGAGLANVVASGFWGKIVDASTRSVMALSGVVAAGAAMLALIFPLLPEAIRTPVAFALVIVVASIAEAGLRLGRKTYLIDMSPKDERPLYTAFSNLVAGLAMLLLGLLGVLADIVSVEASIVVLAVLALAGAALSRALPDVSAGA